MNTIAKYAASTFLGFGLVMSSALFAQEAQPASDPAATQERIQTQTRDQTGAGNQMKQQQAREQKQDKTGTSDQMKRQQSRDQAGAGNQMKQRERQSQSQRSNQGQSGQSRRGGGRG